MYKPVLPQITRALIRSKTNRIIDLGSGGGGGILWLNSELIKEIPGLKIILTDFYPNLPAFEYTKAKAGNIEYIEKPVDARVVPAGLGGLRTQFLSLHHFRPADASLILQNAVDTGNPIAIFEAQERSFQSLLAMAFSPISVLLVTPFIRPLKIGRFIFTYLIPLVPIFILWDGIVSSLRTYSVRELHTMVANLRDTENYDWEIDKVTSGPGKVIYLIGIMKEQNAENNGQHI